MTAPLSLWQELMLLALAGAAAIYVFYFRIWLVVAVGSDLLFGLALAGAVASVVWPDGFDVAAHWVVDRSPLPAALARADAKVAAIAALPSELVDAALARLGYSPDPDPAPEPPTVASGERGGARTANGEANALEAGEDAPGLFVATVRPSIEGLVAVILRGATFVCSGFLLLVALASRASSSTARRLASVAARLERLEAIAAGEDGNAGEVGGAEHAGRRANRADASRGERT